MSSWTERLAAGFRRTSEKLGGGLAGLSFAGLAGGALDADTLDAVEEVLIAADLGSPTAARIRSALEARRFGSDLDEAGLRRVVADEIAAVLTPVAKPLEIVALLTGTR